MWRPDREWRVDLVWQLEQNSNNRIMWHTHVLAIFSLIRVYHLHFSFNYSLT